MIQQFIRKACFVWTMNNISHQLNSLDSLMSPLEHLEDGLKMEKLDAFDQTEENESITSTISRKSSESHRSSNMITPSVMHVSVPITKSTTSTDKQPCSNNTIQPLKLLKTLVLDSIGTDQVLDPFWNKHTLELSQKLWLPTKIDCADLDTSLLNGSSKKLMLNSWYSARMMTSKTCLENSQMTFLQSLQSLLQKTTDSEQLITENKESLNKKKRLQTQLKQQQNLQKLLDNESVEDKLVRQQKDKEYKERLNKQEANKNKRITQQKETCKKNNVEYMPKSQKEDAGKAFRVRIYPTADQRHVLKKWFGVRRWVYNQCLAKMNKGDKLNLKEYRKSIINNENFKTVNTWMLQYEYDLRDEALQDFFKNVKSNKEKGDNFKMQFKSRKLINKESLSVLSKKWNKKNNFYSSVFKPSVLKSSEVLPSDLKYTSRLVHTETGRYFICIPKPMELQSENQAHKEMIFIDPGQVDFVTGYDPSGNMLVWGENDSVRIARLLHHRRKLHSKYIKESDKRRKQRLKTAWLKIYNQIENLVEEMHKKLALWLCKNYKSIYIPRLNFHNMKNLNKKSKTVIACLQHCAFLNRLINKSKEFPGCKVIEVNEAFTTKTCGCCGYQKDDIKRNRTYKCNACEAEIGRDVNASRNVMLRYFTKTFKLRFETELLT